ncbi:GTPase-activating protein, putative [Plasmodium knowlesi strain H]|uniref:GTPase-activating protein, putative n=3 Tax=Plasmodium knowlesi TaxID=5850 RepID=A0A5K1UYJ9_PLAKH|nr:GTPase-activating protein, putative [Plasmodium knowlesi strain H]OTN64892.1 putative GTPase activator protein [Plasmodium knowlesi]CAA9988165.1 GTPase-activating protein, putative [Plasmodium knowlesi strain H]SBO20070.1 GTPase-activating protein, putative [Plasmodium knowlesi strain H]SBO20743.1 GTPase-activating protein, putative [Plasmodium knowlesi strain H]VVS77639.1 GTPase-activating protein, putative [Plasmodium knowlesi strain H]|eukprot:XP_002259141.1 GTPase activator protein, putative [Plasmodium knowlesi strain H]
MRINFFKEKNKIKLNKNFDLESDNAFSNANPESNNYLTANSDNEYDHYGFEKNKEYPAESTTDKGELEKHKKKIEKRWQLYFTFKRDIKKSYYLKTLIRKGIPDKLRPDIWPYLLDSMVLYLKYPTIYEKCLNSELEAKVLSQIELDIIRTFPHNKNYRMNSPGLIQLRNVLHAFAVYKPKINYCQSMNFIAAIALIFLKEELAFWSIVQLIDSDYSHEKINISDYYNNEMRGLRRDIIVIEELIRTKLPDVHLRLKEFDVDLSWICSEWLLCLFCTAFPITTTLRIWDCLFYEGDKIIFRITLALFKMNQEKLIELNSLESILLLFKETTKNMVECDKLMYIAFNEIGVLKKKHIRKLRAKAEGIIKSGVT